MIRSEYNGSQYDEDSEFELSEDEAEHLPEEDDEPLSTEPGTDDQTSLSNPTSPAANPAPALSSLSDGSNNQFINHIDSVMNKVRSLAADPNWSRVLKHRSGVEVLAQKNVEMIGNKKSATVFKGVGLIKGYSPASVFAVIGSSKLWDEWYEDGNLVENLSDQVSLTYMCMQAALGIRTRDLSLVEKVEVTDEGAIFFCASSIDTPRVPQVPGRVRTHIALHAWVLEPVNLPTDGSSEPISTIATKVAHYLQVDVKTFVPEAISQRYLAKRPLCITKIDSYLQKHGSPIQIEGVEESESHPRQGGTRKSFNRGFLSVSQLNQSPRSRESRSTSSSIVSPRSSPALRDSVRHKKYPFGSLGRSQKSSPSPHLSSSPSVPEINSKRTPSVTEPNGAALHKRSPSSLNKHVHRDDDQVLMIDHVKANESIASFEALTISLETFLTQFKELAANDRSWTVVKESANLRKIWYRQSVPSAGSTTTNHYRLPIAGGEVIMSTQCGDSLHPLTKEQVLMTVTSSVAQQIWDVNFSAHSLLDTPVSRRQSLIATHNGFDQASYLASMRGLHPHLPESSLFCFDQLVTRKAPNNREDSVQAKLIVVQRSCKTDDLLNSFKEGKACHPASSQLETLIKDSVEAKTLSHLDMSGWMIETGALRDEIKLTHISALELNLTRQKLSSRSSIPSFLERILVSQISQRPDQVYQFIRENGFFPGFVRWNEGEMIYMGDCVASEEGPEAGRGELDRGRRGEIEWKFARKQKGATEAVVEAITTSLGQPTEQICWFQWSDQMYPHGIELTLDPPEAGRVMRVKKMYNTLQFGWLPASSGPTGEVNLRAKHMTEQPVSSPSQRSLGRVMLNGQLLVEEVYPPVRSSKRKVSTASRASKALREVTAEPFSNVVIAKVSRAELVNLNTQPRPSVSSSTTAAGLVLTTSASDPRSSPTSELSTAHRNKVLVNSNVMLIITEDLHFTKAQVLFLTICVGLAWAYGKFA